MRTSLEERPNPRTAGRPGLGDLDGTRDFPLTSSELKQMSAAYNEEKGLHELSAKSFHGAIIGNKESHKQVTAYDVAIGKGTASTDPRFYAYLCAVADWRLKQLAKNTILRPEIPLGSKFLIEQEPFWSVEWSRLMPTGQVGRSESMV